jgi:hypothetical protein
MWRRVVCWDATDVSEEHIASIFRVKENFSKNQRVSRWQETSRLESFQSIWMQSFYVSSQETSQVKGL